MSTPSVVHRTTATHDREAESTSHDQPEKPWLRGIVLSITIIIAVCIGLFTAARVPDVLGEPAGCITLAASKGSAFFAYFAVIVLLLLLAMGAGRLVNAVVGVFVLGCGLAALSMVSGSISSMAFVGASLSSMAVETLLWSIPSAVAVILVFRAAGSPPDIAQRFPGESMFREFFDAEAIRAGVVGVLLPLILWLVDRNMLKGQAMGAACVGGIAVGVAYRMVAPRVQPVFAFIAPILITGAVQAFVASRGSTDVGTLFASNELSPGLRALPLDVVSGSLTGVAIGIGWARSFRRSDTITS